MGYVFGMRLCYACGQTFTFSPTRVPSIPAHLTSTGEKEPVCRSCIEQANPERVKRGLAPIVILRGAYEGDPCL